ncbi:MAG: RES family NAD+ phosphorylase [Verrucomicrobiota bacterium]
MSERPLLLWRLVKQARADSAFDGEGAFRFGGRWNSRGRRMVYCSGTLSLAVLEVLVHLDPAAGLPELCALSIEIPREHLAYASSATGGRQTLDFPHTLGETRAEGDRWLEAGQRAAMAVPSAIVPNEHNYLLNPRHPAFAGFAIGESLPFTLDRRFFA